MSAGEFTTVAEVKAARLVEAMGGSVIEVPLAAVLDVQIATLKKASRGDARSEAAASSGARPTPSKAPCRGWTMKGSE